MTSAQLSLPLYPYMFLAPNGQVFLAGPDQMTRYLDTSGSGQWTNVGNRTTADRDYGSSVTYDAGKVLIAGGGSQPPTNTAEVIDLNAAQPAWRAVAPMANARRQMSATMLPDGQVLVNGGTSSPGFNVPDGAVFAAELWNPETEQWTTMASARTMRIYHSIAILLPDARVLTSGGDNILSTEIFSPPYLFAGARPAISSAPAAVARNQTFFLGTADGANITQANWIRLGSVTHTLGMSQAFARSSFAQVAGGLNVTVPASPNIAPGGHYMLFILKDGVPSVAKIIRIADGINAPAVFSFSPSSAAAAGGQFTLTVNGSSFVNGAKVRWNGNDRTTTFFSATQLQATIPASDIAATGTASITVTKPDGFISNAIAFTVGPPDTPAPSAPAGAIQFSAPNYTVAEGGGNAGITVTRKGGSAGLVSATFNTSNGSAVAASDYTKCMAPVPLARASSNGSAVAASDYTAVNNFFVTFSDGDTAARTINVPITQDAIDDDNETVNLALTNVTGGATIGTAAAVLTITDDDEPRETKGNDGSGGANPPSGGGGGGCALMPGGPADFGLTLLLLAGTFYGFRRRSGK